MTTPYTDAHTDRTSTTQDTPMTTPDDRVRADFGDRQAPMPTRRRDTVYVGTSAEDFARETAGAKITAPPIDTSTTAGKVAVMQAHADDWRKVECRKRHGTDDWSPLTEGTPLPGDEPAWNWQDYDYRIAPPPPVRTALAEARRSIATGGWPKGSIAEKLVAEIDRSIVVTIEHFKLPHYGATKVEDLQPGRYRLVRDDSPGDAS